MSTTKHNLSEDIQFTSIYKDTFEDYLDVMKEYSEDDYNAEAKDGFLSLYNYWNGLRKPASSLRHKVRDLRASINFRKREMFLSEITRDYMAM